MEDKQSKQDELRAELERKIDVEYIPPKKEMFFRDFLNAVLRVAPYCRVSTGSDDQLASYEMQIHAYKELVASHANWELVDIYADEGISGTSVRKRSEFNRMIEDCKAGKIDLIITKNIPRFARNVVDCVSTARMLKNLNPPVGVYFEDVGINTATQTGELLLVILAAIAQGESETKSESVKWGFRKRFESGIPKIAPLYGYVKEGRNLYINEAEETVVRLIYQMFMEGYPISHICMVLNSQGIPSPKGVEWTYSTVRNILRNEKYAGDIVMQKTVSVDIFSHKSIQNDGRAGQYRVRNHHDPIIERDIWDKVQTKFENSLQDRYTWDFWIEKDDKLEGALSGFDVVKPVSPRR